MTQPKKILYIEDNMANQILVKRALEHSGHELVTIGDGIRGIEVAHEFDPNLILMDINLPKLNGTEITSRLRNSPKFKQIPIVALTADNSESNRKKALAVGCDGFIGKPIDIKTFPETINSFLNGFRDKLNASDHNEGLKAYTNDLVTRLENKVMELEIANRGLESATERLRELDRLKSDFIKLVSHELRTPLTLITGYNFLLTERAKAAKGNDGAQLSAISTGLSQGIDRLSEVVSEIISVSRISGQSLDLSMGPVKIKEVVSAAINHFEGPLEDRSLQIKFENPAHLPVIQADGLQLKVALQNILSNAIKFTPDNGQISITYQIMDKALAVSIKDSGIG
ncbi:MAG: response regulator, partial [Chloroflexota bacterium]